MCFFAESFGGSVTRRDALAAIAGLATLPIMPSQSLTPLARQLNGSRRFTSIVGTTALIGDDLTPLANAEILIAENRIERVGPADAVTIPESALRIDASGTWTIPGLIDSHVHFFQSGGLYTRPDAIDLRTIRPYTDELQWIRSNLLDTFARYLRAGITSVVDVGGPFWNYDVRAIAQRTPLSPRVMAAGPLISSVDRSILDPYGDPPIVKIDTPDAARSLIDRELAAHTDFVKFWWIVTPQHPAIAFAPVARAAIEYAHQRGARVIIHATELETATLAVESGTDILAHSVFDTDVDDRFLELVRSRKVIYCPTLMVVGNYGYTFAGAPNLTAVDLRFANPDVIGTLFNMREVEAALSPALLKRIRALRLPELPHAAMRNLKRVHESGIAIAAGTDAGNIGTQHASSFYNEALHMVESGLSPKETLLTATRGGAAMMGRSSDLGTIAPGKLADLVLLDADPLADIGAIAGVRTVVRDGRVYDAASILNEGPEQIVQRQVNAYNHRDAKVLAATYALNAVVHGDGSPLRSRTAIEHAYRDQFIKHPKVHAEIVERQVHGDVVVDHERITGFADERIVEATVTYTVRHSVIAEARIEATTRG
jgi:imidazolonepropionase-like amidohydrolase